MNPQDIRAEIARLVEQYAATSLRPATDDHQPVWAQREGVWQLNGFYRHGYLVAPAMVQRAERDLLALLRSQTVETLG